MAKISFFKIDPGARTSSELKVLIDNIDAIILELQTTALRAVAQGDIAEYDLETGQTTTRVKYTNQKTILQAITGYEKLRQLYVNKCIPRKKRLMHGKNFRR